MVKAQAVEQPTANHKHVEELSEWYFVKIRKLDSTSAMDSLNTLFKRSIDHNDQTGQAASLFFKGQYISIRSHHFDDGLTLMKQAIDKANMNADQFQWAVYLHHLGFMYFSNSGYKQGLTLMLKANEVFLRIGYDHLPGQGGYMYRLAFVYYNLANYDECIRYLRLLLNSTADPSEKGAVILNTIGQSYSNMFMYDSAMYYFQNTHALALKKKDTAWMGISSGNIASLYIKQSKYKDATPYARNYYQYAVVSRQFACQGEALAMLADLSTENNNADSALVLLKKAMPIFERGSDSFKITFANYNRLHYYYKIATKVYEHLNDQKNSYKYIKLAAEVNDSLQRRYLLSGAMNVTQQLQAEKNLSDTHLLEQEKQTAVIKRNGIIAGSILLLMIMLLFLNRMHIKQRAERRLHEKHVELERSQKQKVVAELDHSKEMLASFTGYLKEKTELVSQLEEEFHKLKQSQNEAVLNPEHMSMLVSSTILTKDQWSEFQVLFDKVHSGFLQRLLEKFPGISPAEVRILALTKLQIPSKAMAAMLGVNSDTIKKTRQRLRKRVNISEDITLESIIDAI